MIVEDLAFYIFLILCGIELILLYYLMKTFLNVELMVYRVEKKIDRLKTKIDELETQTNEIQSTADRFQKKK